MKILRERFKPLTALGIILVHLVAGYALWRMFTTGFSASAWLTLVLMWAIGGVGITVGYHRYMTHQTFHCSPFVEKLFYAFSTMAFQGTGIWWGEVHTQHHAHADEKGDPHWPGEFGGGILGFV